MHKRIPALVFQLRCVWTIVILDTWLNIYGRHSSGQLEPASVALLLDAQVKDLLLWTPPYSNSAAAVIQKCSKEETFACTNSPPPAAATVAGEAPASRSWFCREKSMLYHSAPLSTGLGGITRFGFSRTSRT